MICIICGKEKPVNTKTKEEICAVCYKDIQKEHKDVKGEDDE